VRAYGISPSPFIRRRIDNESEALPLAQSHHLGGHVRIMLMDAPNLLF